jgi:small-conductance mechanosensitive channel
MRPGTLRIWLGLALAALLLVAWAKLDQAPPGMLPAMPPALLAQALAVLAAFAAAFAVDGAIRRYLWYGMLGDDGRPRAPAIVIGLASLGGYALTGLLVAGLVLGLDISAVAATSGVVAIVLGVSAQQTLGQVFAGLALNLSRPFRIGDSLQVDGVWGRVMQADWRAVTLRTYEGTLVTLPNTLAAAARLTNLQTPTDILRHAIPFVMEPDAPPGRVRAVALAAMQGMEHVLPSPAPLVLFKEYEERGLRFEALFWHRDPNLYILRRDEVGQALWYALRRAGLPVAAHRRLLAGPDGPALPEAPMVPSARVAALLHETRLWGGVPNAELLALAARARVVGYAAGERIMRDGEDGASMFLLLEGKVSVRLGDAAGEERDLHPGRRRGVRAHVGADRRAALRHRARSGCGDPRRVRQGQPGAAGGGAPGGGGGGGAGDPAAA